ncbi:HypC/HybG/HupF family hydrogenase formation chaperone [Candidatus Kuenenbacteria bacterium HGW-Kuenenbacteria-1]|uniref:HypC/HybG/HupF family hydrogenase formation chaperone n=1 Tax=Candidatus Kuenenbacteria bacterium HGW-Kuenenbacteria-1 TaxID=2013812 RepID=A0A2N1UNH3_9BACT|nr:MAG: HypC/HybG/HupF family hydrogenase formation chaperone [Candidatus Kuenenbacteria bacterium HGW-Kuenenbacteria-1]
MCLAIPGKIIKINKEKAIVDFDGIKKEINISLVKVKIKDYVIIHAGFAIQKIEKQEAIEALKF